MNDFIALLEVRPTRDDALPGAAGAFVRAYAHATEEEEALASMRALLADRGLAIIDVAGIVDHADVEWERAEPHAELCRLAARTRGVQLSEFHTYPS